MERKRPFRLETCFKLGLFGNICFVAFIIICLIYYYTFSPSGTFRLGFDIAAYIVEFAGFGLMALAIAGICCIVRQRGLMKALLSVYVCVEVFLMLLDFDFIHLDIYNGRSNLLIILHAIFSALVGFSLLSLDPKRTRLEMLVGIAVSMILAGMFSAVLNLRVYGSILMNAFAYIFLHRFGITTTGRRSRSTATETVPRYRNTRVRFLRMNDERTNSLSA